MTEQASTTTSPSLLLRFLSSMSFDRWLLTWLSVLLAHVGIYAIGYDLLATLRSSEIGLSYFEGFLLPTATSFVVVLAAYVTWRRSYVMSRWSDVVMAWHAGFFAVLLLLAQASLFTVQVGLVLGAFSAVSDVEAVEQAKQAFYGSRPIALVVILACYLLGLGLMMLEARLRRIVVAGLQGGLLVALVLGLISIVDAGRSAEIRLAQPGASDVFFAWQSSGEGCVDYRFTAEGAREIWLGQDGLASIEPMNYGRYCDVAPRVLRVVTSDGQEHRYLVGDIWVWLRPADWWQVLLVGLIVPLFILSASYIAARYSYLPVQLIASVALIALFNIVAVEFVAYVYLGQQNDHEPFLFNRLDTRGSIVSAEATPPTGDALDVHLGYTYSEYVTGQTSRTEELLPRVDHWWMEGGLLAYAPVGQELRRPIIVMLGGSTTDGLLRWGESTPWPEQLAKLLHSHALSGTIVNGGMAGYSSNQELLKLVRDVLSIQPDLVIAYHGINESRWRVQGYPMVHPYQQQLFEALAKPSSASVLPNFIRLMRRLVGFSDVGISVSYGAPSSLSDGQQWVRNIGLMYAIAQAQQIEYLSILQPVMGVGSAPISGEAWQWQLSRLGSEQALQDYYDRLQATYAEALQAATQYPYILDFTEVLTGQDDVYLLDGRHLTEKGNAIIAEKIFEVLESRLLRNNNASALSSAWTSSVNRPLIGRVTLAFSCSQASFIHV